MHETEIYLRCPIEPPGRDQGRLVDVEMSFSEIGAVLGISRHCAEVHYRNAMKKLRQKHPRALAWLRILAEERAALMQERLRGAGGPGVEG